MAKHPPLDALTTALSSSSEGPDARLSRGVSFDAELLLSSRDPLSSASDVLRKPNRLRRRPIELALRLVIIELFRDAPVVCG
jgi:hypothetical protein